MPTLSLDTSPFRSPVWLAAVALGGIAWNTFGAVQLAGSVTATEQDLIASGLTPRQAAVTAGYPFWMTFAFALGVAGGFFGSLLLLFRHRLARIVLGVSLAAYVALWIGWG